MAWLEVVNLSKSFGGLLALDKVSFEMDQGEMVGIVGPNGAGKTTLFNTLTGSLPKDEGEVMFKGRDISRIKPHQAVHLGIYRTFQLTGSFDGMTVFDNVKIAALARSGDSSLDDKVKEAIKEVDLEGREDLVPGQLPYGDLKRLDIARALASSPELMLLDEPFSGLSFSEIRGIAEVLRRIQARGVTLLIIEHVLRELMALAGRVIVLNFGKKLAEGSPKEVVENAEVIEAYLGGESYAV